LMSNAIPYKTILYFSEKETKFHHLIDFCDGK
jgi:hypothetical protein